MVSSFKSSNNLFINKSPVQDALSWWKTDELGALLIGRGKRTKRILGPFS